MHHNRELKRRGSKTLNARLNMETYYILKDEYLGAMQVYSSKQDAEKDLAEWQIKFPKAKFWIEERTITL